MPNWKKIIVSGSDASLSSAYIEGNLTASAAFLTSASIGHLETIYETASVIYSSGSTKFGDTSDDTHERTGSLLVSGNITLSEGTQLTGTSSFAITASHATNVPTTASHALTAITASHTAGTASFANSAITSSHTTGTASFANNATSASYSSTGDGIFSGSFSGSFVGDASSLNVNPFPFTGSGEMQGTLTVHSDNSYVDDYAESYFAGIAINSDGDMTVTGSIFSTYINANTFTGSLSGSATSSSLAETASYFNGVVTSASFAESSSVTTLATTAITTTGTASIANTSTSASHTIGTASIANFATTASHVVTASFANTSTTASYGLNMTASSIRVEGTASIVFLESVYETSSIIYSSGSTKFGDDTSDIHERTGSLMTSGSLSVTGSANLIASQSLNNRDSSGLSYWAGSQAQYDALGSYDSNTIYFVT